MVRFSMIEALRRGILAALLLASGTWAVAGQMTWVIYDGCPGRESIQYKFWDRKNNWVWPSADKVYYTKKLGEGYRETISCTPRSKVCYGAWQNNANRFWGVGQSGDGACPNCCARCDGGTYEMRLTC